jgi:hypothetical protein
MVFTAADDDTFCRQTIQSELFNVAFSNVTFWVYLTLKISSDQIWVAGYFGQPLTYPDFTIFISDFLCNSLKS